jgi:transcriptional regulator with XRE-family HTH domain
MQWSSGDAKKEFAQDLGRQLGAAVRTRREKLGISQEELAFRAGVYRSYMSDVEQGKKTLNLGTLGRLALALECRLDELVSDVELDTKNYPS